MLRGFARFMMCVATGDALNGKNAARDPGGQILIPQ
jgi:hypothetical protein